MLSEDNIVITKTLIVGLSGAVLGLFNEPIFDTVLGFLWSFGSITEAVEIYSKLGGAIAVTLSCIYLVQKITGKRK